MKTLISGLAILLLGWAPGFFNVTHAVEALTDPSIESRIDELLAKMTVEEKIGQLNQYSSIYDLT